MNTTVVLDKHEVVVDRAYLESLEADSNMMACLDACGVDGWDGYGEAQEMNEENTD
jgi:hypothetical protein